MRRWLFLAALALTASPAAAQDMGGSDGPMQDAAGQPAPDQPAPRAQPQKYIAPYIEIGQALDADLTYDDVLTYSEVAAGVDAGIATRSTQAQLSYRYERDIGWGKHLNDSDYHQGLARAAVGVAPGVSIEGGGLAARARSDIRSAAPAASNPDGDNLSQVYAAYVGPTVATHVGILGVSGSYRFGYTKVESPSYIPLAADQPRLDLFDSAISNTAQASVGVAPGDVLPVGITVSGGWDREDAHQLDQRYQGTFARADLLFPVSRTLALEAGAGYEKITIGQRDALVDADGSPVTDASGRFVTDKSSPRRIAYRTDGLIYDGGVLWRPSPRTQLEAHVGRRYGGTSYAGSLTWQATRTVGARVVVYDDVETFARQLRNGIDGLPTSFLTGGNVFGNAFGGCTFGTSGDHPGGCLNDVFQSISSSGYRARGVDAVIAATRGPVQMGFGVGYARRHFYAPDTNETFTINGVDDESFYAQYFYNRALDARSSLGANLYADYYDSGISGAAGVYSFGASGTYNRHFGRIDTTASLGVFTYDSRDIENDVSAQALVSARYNF